MRKDDIPIDLSDIPEITDFSGVRKNPYAEKLRKNGYSIVINVSPEDVADMTREAVERIENMDMSDFDELEQEALRQYAETHKKYV